MLLSRVAEHLYWAGRYLERAECTARVVREHTNLLVDLPTWVRLTWEPLLAIEGDRAAFDRHHDRADERSIVTWLVASPDNPSSVLASVDRTRTNLRTTREVIPRELWQVVNDLYLYVTGHHSEGVARRSRTRFLDRVVADAQRVAGIVDTTMRRDEAADFLQLGRLVERADMTTRVLDVRAVGILRNEDPDAFVDVQWAGVLRSVSALQMFQRATRAAVSGPATVRFLLCDHAFPRSVAFCLAEVARLARALPAGDRVQPACEQALALLPEETAGDGDALHRLADRLQLAIAAVHDALADAYFRPALPLP